MIGGALLYRVPPTGWKPEGWTAPAKKASNAMITHRHVHVNVAWKTPQFRLVWLVLCLNVSAVSVSWAWLRRCCRKCLAANPGCRCAIWSIDAGQLASIAAIAAGFTGLLSLFNIGGRFFWASFSDYLGRKTPTSCSSALGFALYALIPNLGHLVMWRCS